MSDPDATGRAALDYGYVRRDDGMWEKRMPNGEVLVSTSPPRYRDDDILTGTAIAEVDPAARGVIQKGIAVDARDDTDRCMNEWAVRTKAVGDVDINWSMFVTVSARDGMATITNARISDSGWPTELDEPARDCYLGVLRGRSFPSEHEFSHTVEYDFCIKGHRSADAARGSSGS